MAYKVPKVSPSALAATEHCPRFRPDGKDNDAAIDGTLFHEFAEQMVQQPPDQWEGWIATREASPDIKGLLEEACARLKTVVIEPLPVFPDYRLRMRAGKPRKTPLKPGLYPELELERGQGRHGYVDLLVITTEGLAYILDYKTNRVEKDFSLQLKAYACDINRLCPAHGNFVCEIIAPRLDDDAQLRIEIGPDDIAKANAQIAAIEARADQSANDDSIPGVPCDACQYCHWCGTCRYQAAAANTVMTTVDTDQKTVTPKTGKVTVIPALHSLVGPGGAYEGETLSVQTFTNPATVEQRGLRRACLKFLEVLIDAAKEDDSTWCAQWNDEQLKTLVPGFSVSRVNGRSSVDKSRMSEIREAVMARFGLSIEDVFEVSSVDTAMLAKSLVDVNGYTEKKAKEEIKKVLEPFSTVGAPSVRWSQKVPKKIDAEFIDVR